MRGLAGLAGRAATATVLAAAAGLLLTTPASAASEWDLDTTADATGFLQPFGNPDTATYGQTITIPDGPDTIESFSFQMTIPATVIFRGAVQAWDPVAMTATGPVLYLSDPVSTTGVATQTVTFTHDIAVTPGTYVLYATTSYDWTAANDVGSWPTTSTDAYPGGIFVCQNNGDDESALTGASWDAPTTRDAAFTIVFAGAPVAPPVTPPAAPATPAIRPPAYTG